MSDARREKHKMRRGYNGQTPVMYCRECKGSGASLTKHCVGRQLTDAEEADIASGRLDFVGGEWRRTDGVAPTVPVNRPATAAEAQHAARIGACLPNGVLFDAFGNPRKRYTRVSLDGAHLILDDVQLADFKASQTDDPEQYTYSDVYLSQEEADALPEFDGF